MKAGNSYFWTYCQLAVFGCSLAAFGCNDVCDVEQSKCEGNKIHICFGSNSHNDTLWREFRDCSNFDAICVDNVKIEFFDPRTHSNDIFSYIESLDHSCVKKDIDCAGESGSFCSDDMRFVVNCVETNDSMQVVPAIGVENWEDRPHCVSTFKGVAFAYDENLCTAGEMKCDTSGRTLKCLEETWQLNSSSCVLEE